MLASWFYMISYLVVGTFAFGIRALIHRRRTGSSGMNGISGPAFSAAWWAGVLFAVAIALGLLAPIAALVGVVEPIGAMVAVPLQLVAAVLILAGGTATVLAQAAMGASWRVGVDEGEITTLVTGGPFRLVRNPIFTAMATTSIGWTLLVPSALSLAALAALITAIELQVRVIEEPYLIRTHGSDYLTYASSAGRFVPALGRLSAAAS
ncbi:MULTISPECIES: methyltransferase family protein [unclassified Streptosporangium]|uniref:methyltransferase family protein n=1 Tax=unclassified Streptosporangium TaxID=2632669 RepID=UPI002E2B2CAC|nr:MULTISPECIES: isoprenylcysteine carboxylmethyltransferase family protein [unclassified Streptosporangium]